MVRFGTFETNSSSAHTFVLKSENTYTTDAEIQEYFDYIETNAPEIPKGYLAVQNYFGDAEYGRGFAFIYEWENKMSYVLATYKYETDNLKKIINIIKERTGAKGIAIPAYYNSWDDEDDNTDVPLYTDSDYCFDGFGDVDHQSGDNVSNAIKAIKSFPEFADKTFEELIFEIIFNNKFVIIVDSDESYHFDSLVEAGMIDCNEFSHVLQYSYDAGTKQGGYEFEVFSDYEDNLRKDEY